jgi:hypothetical protein
MKSYLEKYLKYKHKYILLKKTLYGGLEQWEEKAKAKEKAMAQKKYCKEQEDKAVAEIDLKDMKVIINEAENPWFNGYYPFFNEALKNTKFTSNVNYDTLLANIKNYIPGHNIRIEKIIPEYAYGEFGEINIYFYRKINGENRFYKSINNSNNSLEDSTMEDYLKEYNTIIFWSKVKEEGKPTRTIRYKTNEEKLAAEARLAEKARLAKIAEEKGSFILMFTKKEKDQTRIRLCKINHPSRIQDVKSVASEDFRFFTPRKIYTHLNIKDTPKVSQPILLG